MLRIALSYLNVFNYFAMIFLNYGFATELKCFEDANHTSLQYCHTLKELLLLLYIESIIQVIMKTQQLK